MDYWNYNLKKCKEEEKWGKWKAHEVGSRMGRRMEEKVKARLGQNFGECGTRRTYLTLCTPPRIHVLSDAIDSHFNLTCGPLCMGLTNLFRPNFRCSKAQAHLRSGPRLPFWWTNYRFCVCSYSPRSVLWFHPVTDLLPAFDHGWLFM